MSGECMSTVLSGEVGRNTNFTNPQSLRDAPHTSIQACDWHAISPKRKGAGAWRRRRDARQSSAEAEHTTAPTRIGRGSGCLRLRPQPIRACGSAACATFGEKCLRRGWKRAELSRAAVEEHADARFADATDSLTSILKKEPRTKTLWRIFVTCNRH